jgi:hypothetical protein
MADGTSAGTPNNLYRNPAGVAGLPESWAQQYIVGSLAGVPIVTDANIPLGDTNTSAKGGVFVKSALVYAEMWPVTIEEENDPSLRGTELNATTCYAYQERTDSWGVELYVGATAPTGTTNIS